MRGRSRGALCALQHAAPSVNLLCQSTCCADRTLVNLGISARKSPCLQVAIEPFAGTLSEKLRMQQNIPHVHKRISKET
jgi:hypothetical protein